MTSETDTTTNKEEAAATMVTAEEFLDISPTTTRGGQLSRAGKAVTLTCLGFGLHLSVSSGRRNIKSHGISVTTILHLSN